MMKGTEFKLEKMGEVAVEIYNLYSFGPSSSSKNGEFLSFTEDDVTRYAVHIHFYTRDLALEEDRVTLPCHAIWAKSKEGWYRQQLTLTATNQGKLWTAELTKGDVQVIEGTKQAKKFDPPVNQELKNRLFTDVVDQLADILAYTLNQ